MNQIINLNGTWQLRWNDGERGERPKRVMAGDVNWSRAWSASVPGSVHEALLEHGAIPDPGIGTNVLACRWVEETVWYYRRTFKLPSLRKGERVWLFFETLDLAANIYLNGVQIGSHANAFHPCRVEGFEATMDFGREAIAAFFRFDSRHIPDAVGEFFPRVSRDGVQVAHEAWWRFGGIVKQREDHTPLAVAHHADNHSIFGQFVAIAEAA